MCEVVCGGQLTAVAAACRYRRFDQEIEKLADSAALIARVDLVIVADSVATHLACAMGKPVWMMLPFKANWHWTIDRRDLPWYPSLKLLHQNKPGDWASVVSAIAHELDRWRG